MDQCSLCKSPCLVDYFAFSCSQKNVLCQVCKQSYYDSDQDWICPFCKKQAGCSLIPMKALQTELPKTIMLNIDVSDVKLGENTLISVEIGMTEDDLLDKIKKIYEDYTPVYYQAILNGRTLRKDSIKRKIGTKDKDGILALNNHVVYIKKRNDGGENMN